MKTVTVRFTERYNSGYSQKEYDYLVEDSVEVTAGDHAVAHNGSEFAIVKVMSVKAGASSKATKTLVTILNENTLMAYKDMNEKVRSRRLSLLVLSSLCYKRLRITSIDFLQLLMQKRLRFSHSLESRNTSRGR